MSLGSFASLALKALPLTKNISPWPKRFVSGFQRLWEAISWNLNVRYNVTVRSIVRTEQGVHVKFTQEQQVLDSTDALERELEFDYIIFACPIGPRLLEIGDFSDDETSLLRKMQSYSYCLTSFTTKNLNMPHPIAASLPLPAIGKPWAITQQFPECHVFQFYSRVPNELLDEPDHQTTAIRDGERPASADRTAREKEMDDPVRGHIIHEVREAIRELGGTIDEAEWQTYDRWSYFPHIRGDDMRAGFFQELESL